MAAIVGLSGSGKTWLATRLQAGLGAETVSVLALDDFYRDLSGLGAAARSAVNFDHPDAIDWEGLMAALDRCVAGAEVRTPHYDFATHTRQEGRFWRATPAVIVEGLWLLWPERVRERFDLKIFLQAAPELCWERRLARDQRERARGEESIRRQFFEQVLPMAERYVLPQARWADLTLTSPVTPAQVERAGERIRRLLRITGERREIRP